MDFTTAESIGVILASVGAVVIGVWKFRHYLEDREKKKINDKEISPLTTKNIFDSFKNIPFLQKELIAKNYEGLKVRWHVEFQDVYQNHKNSKKMAMTHHVASKYPWVYFNFDSKNFPILKTSKRGDRYYVTGIISKVNEGVIYLKLIDLQNEDIIQSREYKNKPPG